MFSSILTTQLTPSLIAICSATSLAMGAILALTYMQTGRYSRNFPIALFLLPTMVQMVIMMVNGNLGAGVAVAGAFSLVRFRSLPGTSKEIISIFFAMAIGLAKGMGYVGYAAVFTIVLSALMLILYKSNFANGKEADQMLRITIPEELDYSNVFDDIFEKYANKVELERVKTTNLGSMFELSYRVEIKNSALIKEMIDEIRIRNANLPIIMARGEIDKMNEL